jgi:hypothetical protein
VTLLAFAVDAVIRAVRQVHAQLATRPCPGAVRLPRIGVLLRHRVVTQAAAACRDRLLDVVHRHTAAFLTVHVETGAA